MNSQIGPRLVSGVLLLQWGSKAALSCPPSPIWFLRSLSFLSLEVAAGGKESLSHDGVAHSV